MQQITGLLDLTGRIARIAGPAGIGLLLLFVSEVQLFALNGATFAVSAMALRRLARRYATSAGGAAERPGAGCGRPSRRVRRCVSTRGSDWRSACTV